MDLDDLRMLLKAQRPHLVVLMLSKFAYILDHAQKRFICKITIKVVTQILSNFSTKNSYKLG